MIRYVVGAMLLSAFGTVWAEEAKIPVLTWEPRSDWMNVRDWGTKGDGIADDTIASKLSSIRPPRRTVTMPSPYVTAWSTSRLAGID